MNLTRLIQCAFVVASLAGCGGGGQAADSGVDVLGLPYCYDDPRAEPFTSGATAVGTSGLFTLHATTFSPTPTVRANYTWTIRVTDAQGNAVDGLTMNIVPWMPDHGHGAPVIPQVTPMGSGQYSVDNIDLFMEGIWTVTFTLQSGTMMDTAVFTFCVGP